MSTDLFWRPVPAPTPENDLPYTLKKILGPKFWDHDGSLHGSPVELDHHHGPTVAYLLGLRDAGIDGADTLISALEKHGHIELWIE